MDPIQEEQQALSQQEEFESRLFSEDEHVVIACVPATKAGVNDRSGVPKQYFLVLTVNKHETSDCKLHTVRVKNNGLDLVIQKSPKIHKLKWFEIATEENANSNVWDFKLEWKNGSNDSYCLSPNSLRSVNLFAFIIYNVAIYCSKHQISIKPLELVQLEVHGREYLDKLFTNNLLFRRINAIQQEIFTPIYKKLSLMNSSNSNNNNNKNSDKNEDKKRRLSMRTDAAINTKNDGGANYSKSQYDVPLMSREETDHIKHFMEVCNVSIDNIHLLESKLMERQRDIMKDNIGAFKGNENKLDSLLDNIDKSIDSVQGLQNRLESFQRHIKKMAFGVNQIKRKNHSLAIQDQNNTKLTEKLTDIVSDLKLHAKYEQTLKNPSFRPETEYKRALNAVNILSKKLNLHFTDGLESMQAVKSQRNHFKELNDRFCDAACDHFTKLFERNSALPNKAEVPKNKYAKQKFVGPHSPIHAILFKYDQLLKYISNLHTDKFQNILNEYQAHFSKLYIAEFKQYFEWIRTTIYKGSSSEKRMASVPSTNLAHLIKLQNNDDIELSQSTASTIFSKQSSLSQRGSDANNPNNSARMHDVSMPTISEDTEGDEHKTKITKVFRQTLAVTLPVIIVEQRFMERYFFENNANNEYEKEIERILSAMFKGLESQFISLIDKADSLNNFHTLEMLIISERVLHSYRDYNHFLASLLSKLHTKLTLNWTKFITQEIAWIKSQKISIKQAGILEPMQKFPAFCNEMYKVVTFGDEKSKELTNVSLLIPQIENNEQKQQKEDEVDDDGMNDFVVFRESEQVTNTIHKMTTVLFSWLGNAARSDPKYTKVCLMENYHYFYSVFSRTESLRAIREHVHKSNRAYVDARRDYVKWCVQYECGALSEFWSDLNNKAMNDMETVSVYISSQKVKAICAEYLDSEKKIKKFVNGMFVRLKKHLQENYILFKKIWKKIAQYFCSKYAKFKENVDKIYHTNKGSKGIVKYSMEFVWNQFVDQYRVAFEDNESSVSSSSIGQSSRVSGMSGMTSNSYYYSSQASKKGLSVQAKVKDKQNKAKKGLSSLRRKAKQKLTTSKD